MPQRDKGGLRIQQPHKNKEEKRKKEKGSASTLIAYRNLDSNKSRVPSQPVSFIAVVVRTRRV